MKPYRILGSCRFFCALALILVLGLAGGSAHGDMINGSVNLGAFWVTQDDTDLADSTIFTPYAYSGPGSLYMAGGLGDFALLVTSPPVACTADLLDTTLNTWSFTCPGEGTWTTSDFQTTYDANIADGFLSFVLTGTFTPDSNGSLGSYSATTGEVRIALTQSGSSVSWAGTMTMNPTPIPEPMTMSLLGLGSLALIRRRRR